LPDSKEAGAQEMEGRTLGLCMLKWEVQWTSLVDFEELNYDKEKMRKELELYSAQV